MKIQGQLFTSVVFLFAGTGFTMASGTPLDQLPQSASKAGQTMPVQQALGPAPVQVIVSRKDQRLKVFRGTELIATSRVSTGKAGHTTPTGIFSILEKRKRHFSNLYNDAPMPYMQRLTWSGVALHQSNSVPRYPASHGCVRLPAGFAKNLFSLTERGAHVIISSRDVAPEPIDHDFLFQPKFTRMDNRLTALSLGEMKPLRGYGKIALLSDRPGRDPLARKVASHLNKLKAVREAGKPIRIFITRQPQGNMVADIQAMLNKLGFDAGVVDGIAGKATYGAIKQFVAAKKGSFENRLQNLKPQPSKALLAALYETAGQGVVPSGHLYVRADFKPLFDAPITIRDTEVPLGVHLLTASASLEGSGGLDWLAVNLSDSYSRGMQQNLGLQQDVDLNGDVSPHDILDRIVIPEEIRAQINLLINSGSSLAISDRGISRETTPYGTDFIVLTKPKSGAVRQKKASQKKRPRDSLTQLSQR